MRGDDLRDWVSEHFDEPPLDGERGETADALDAVYGFDPDVFDSVIESVRQSLDPDGDPEDEERIFAMLFFELGHAWHAKRAEQARELEADLLGQ